VQGEVIGPGIQANPLGLTKTRIVVFGYGTFDADRPSSATTRRVPMGQWPAWARVLAPPSYPVTLPTTVAEAIAQVERLDSLVSPGRGVEGIVWTQRDGIGLPGLGGRAVWKSISAHYLLKHGG
jgi:hypothetical protein